MTSVQQPGHFTTRLLRRIKVQLGNWTDILQSQNLPSSCKPQPLSLILQFTGPGPESVECQLCEKDLQPDWRVWNKVFLLNLVKESVEDRQVQHTGESNATSAALAPNIACHKCLAWEYIFHFSRLVSIPRVQAGLQLANLMRSLRCSSLTLTTRPRDLGHTPLVNYLLLTPDQVTIRALIISKCPNDFLVKIHS